jgi:4-amino-4-deoxychorismate lyase
VQGFLRENAISEGTELYIKLLVISLGDLYYGGKAKKSHLEVLVKKYQRPQKPLKLTLSPFRKISSSPLNQIKTTNNLLNVLVKRQALKEGFYDALILNEKDYITETSSANFYCLKGDYFYTPPLECGVLNGTYRQYLFQTLPIREEKLRVKDLHSCEKFFISNALLGLVEVDLEF